MSIIIKDFENQFPKIIEEIFRESYEYIGPLDELHSLLETQKLSLNEKEYHKNVHEWRSDRNSIFVRKFHEYVDKNVKFNETYYKFLRNNILPLFPGESQIVVQKTPNIRFSLPENVAIGYDKNDPIGIIGLHCDRDFGHHEIEHNFIVPITKMFESNSVYHEPYPKSNIEPEDYKSLILNENQFVKAYFNEIKHCNRINKTEKTRISFDIRVIPYSQYQIHLNDFKDTKFELGKYYVVL
jgi:hypothetical protein